MKALRIIVTLFLLAGMANFNPAEAQFGKLKKKAKDKIERKAEEKKREKERAIDRKADEKLDDAVEGAEDSAQNIFKKRAEEAMANMAGLSEEPFDLGPNEQGRASASHVYYRTVSSVNYAGMEQMPEMFRNLMTTNEVHYFHDGVHRSDLRNTSTIINAKSRQIININHDQATYSVQTFDDLAAMIDGMASDASYDNDDADDTPAFDPDDLKISVTETGHKERFHGVETTQKVMVVESLMEREEDGEVTRNKVYFVIDARVSDEIAGHKTIHDINMEIAQAMGAAFGHTGNAFSGMFAMLQQDPAVSGQMEEAVAEMRKMGGGLPVRNDTYIVMGPEDGELDLDAVLTGELASPESAQAMQSGEVTEQTTFMVLTSETGDLNSDKFDSDLLKAPADYTQVEAIANPWAPGQN